LNAVQRAVLLYQIVLAFAAAEMQAMGYETAWVLLSLQMILWGIAAAAYGLAERLEQQYDQHYCMLPINFYGEACEDAGRDFLRPR
jgi:hypothetical protein